jgi:DNA-binding NarL/FixJ family response regulator
MHEKIKVILADDHPLFRNGLRQAVETDPSLEIVAEAADGATALQLIKTQQPHVAVLDVQMPKLSGLQVTREIQKLKLRSRVVFMTMHNEEDLFNKALDAGAVGYVLKESAVTDILDSIHAVAAGKYYLSPAISHFLMNRTARKEVLVKRQPGLEDLTPTERRVLKFIAENTTSKEIASALGVSYRTIETHRTNICQKLNLRGSHSLLRFAFDNRAAL